MDVMDRIVSKCPLCSGEGARDCEVCHGDAYVQNEMVRCSICEGAGRVSLDSWMGHLTDDGVCFVCHGSGLTVRPIALGDTIRWEGSSGHVLYGVVVKLEVPIHASGAWTLTAYCYRTTWLTGFSMPGNYTVVESPDWSRRHKHLVSAHEAYLAALMKYPKWQQYLASHPTAWLFDPEGIPERTQGDAPEQPASMP